MSIIKRILNDLMTIRRMLLIWAVIALGSTLIITWAGLNSNTKLSANQKRLVNSVLPLDEASLDTSIAINSLVNHQSRIIAAESSEDLNVLKTKKELEDTINLSINKLAQLKMNVPEAEEISAKLDQTFNNFLGLNSTMVEKKKSILMLKETIAEKNKLVDKTVQKMQGIAESISGKTSLPVKLTKRKIRKVVNNAEKVDELRGLITELISGKQTEIQQRSNDIKTGVTLLNTLSHKIMLEKNSDTLTSIKENQIVQTVQLIKGILSSLENDFNDSTNLLNQTLQLGEELSALERLLFDGDQSVFSLRMQMIVDEEALDSLSREVVKSIGSIMIDLNGLQQFVGEMSHSATLHSERIVQRSRMTIVVVAIATICVLLILMTVIIRSITKPLDEGVRAANRLANGDLTQFINIQTKDEIGQLGNAFNKLLESLRSIITQIRDVSVQISSSATEINSAAHQQESGATEQSSSVTEAVATIKELSATASAIANNAESVVDIAERTVGGMEEINTKVEDTAQKILALGEKSQSIGNITALISDIAEKTNLLALNAAIEAARAGEAGHGFAVVAQEVRKLAERSSKSSAEIRQLAAEIQNEINSSIIGIEDSTKWVAKGLEMVKEAAQSAIEISTATRQQRNASGQVVKAVEEIDGSTKQFVSATKQTKYSVAQLNQLAKDLTASLSEFKLEEENVDAKKENVEILAGKQA